VRADSHVAQGLHGRLDEGLAALPALEPLIGGPVCPELLSVFFLTMDAFYDDSPDSCSPWFRLLAERLG
jgi:hypothetical protein